MRPLLTFDFLNNSIFTFVSGFSLEVLHVFILADRFYEEFLSDSYGGSLLASVDVFSPEEILSWIRRAGEISIVSSGGDVVDGIARRMEVRITKITPRPIYFPDVLLIPRKSGRFTKFGIMTS